MTDFPVSGIEIIYSNLRRLKEDNIACVGLRHFSCGGYIHVHGAVGTGVATVAASVLAVLAVALVALAM